MSRKYIAATAYFVMHVLVSTVGVIVLSGFLLFGAFSLLRIFNPSISTVVARHLLTEVPLFPVQIVVGALLGFFVGRYMSRTVLKALLCVPVFLLICGVLIGYREGVSLVSHFLGYGCTVAGRCFDQFLITLPALTCLAYACGASIKHIRPASSLKQRFSAGQRA